MKTTLFLLGLALSFCSHADQSATSAVAQYMKASVEFEKLVEELSQVGKLPRLTDENASVLINTLSDTETVLKNPTYTSNEFGALMGVCEKANIFAMGYMLFDLESALSPDDSQDTIRIKSIKAMNQNSQKYQDELTKLQPFVVACQAAQAPLLEAFWLGLPEDDKTSVRIGGVKKFRMGMLQMYSGALASANDVKYKMAFREALFQSVTDAAPTFSQYLSLQERAAILNLLGQYTSTDDGDFSEQVAVITAAMSQRSCNELCQLQ